MEARNVHMCVYVDKVVPRTCISEPSVNIVLGVLFCGIMVIRESQSRENNCLKKKELKDFSVDDNFSFKVNMVVGHDLKFCSI